MLVLSRYKDQSIHIGDDIVITVVDVRGDRIRLGIEAPSSVAVHRQEIYEAIQRDKNDKKHPNSSPDVVLRKRENDVFEFSLTNQ